MSFFDKFKHNFFKSESDLVKIINVDDVELEYIYHRYSSDSLFVVFISQDENEYYDYHTIFRPLKVNQLYIQSDVFLNGKAYIPLKGYENVEKSVFKLINAVVNECEAKKLCFFGFGLDGSHALNYALPYENSIAYLGSPIFNLGTYVESMESEKDEDDLDRTYADVYKIGKLDSCLMSKMLDKWYVRIGKINLQCSVNQPIYTNHVKDLVKFLEKNHFSLNFKKSFYEEDDKSFVSYCEYLISLFEDVSKKKNDNDSK